MAPARINSPGNELIGSPQYFRDCLFALEPSVTTLIDLATEAGWDEQQVIYTLMYFAATNIQDDALLNESPALSETPY
jgi:hypothetical protein